MRRTSTYQENNKLTSIFPVNGNIKEKYFGSIENNKIIAGVTDIIQHFGVAVEEFTNEDGEFILNGHVTIPGAVFTPGKKVAANKEGLIGTVDMIPAYTLSRISGIVFVIGIALTTDTFYLNFDHTKPLEIVVVKGRKYMLEIFSLLDYRTPSPDFQGICLSRISQTDPISEIIVAANWPQLIPVIRDVVWRPYNNSADINYTGFTPGAVTVITLNAANNSSTNDPLLAAIVGMVRYHNSLDAATTLTATHFLTLNLVVNFLGNDIRILDVDLIARTITIDYDSSALSTASGNIQIYPHRVGVNVADNLNKAQVRKLREETTVGSGFSTSTLVENRTQGFKIANAYNQRVTGSNVATGTSYDVIDSDLFPSDDGTNGTFRSGATTRGNIMNVLIYMDGGTYVP